MCVYVGGGWVKEEKVGGRERVRDTERQRPRERERQRAHTQETADPWVFVITMAIALSIVLVSMFGELLDIF